MKKLLLVILMLVMMSSVSFAEGIFDKYNGNVDLYNRPVVDNGDGTFSTVCSFGVCVDHFELLLTPITPDGRWLTDDEIDEAISRFEFVDGIVIPDSDDLCIVINCTDIEGLSLAELEEVWSLGEKLHYEQELYYAQ